MHQVRVSHKTLVSHTPYHTVDGDGQWWAKMASQSQSAGPQDETEASINPRWPKKHQGKHHQLVWHFPGQYPPPNSSHSLKVHAPDHLLWGYTKAPQAKVNYYIFNLFTRYTHAQITSQGSVSPKYNRVFHLPKLQSVQSELGNRPIKNFYYGFVWKLRVLESDITESNLLEEWPWESSLSSQIQVPHVHDNNTYFIGMFWELNEITDIKYLTHSQCK